MHLLEDLKKKTLFTRTTTPHTQQTVLELHMLGLKSVSTKNVGTVKNVHDFQSKKVQTLLDGAFYYLDRIAQFVAH